MTSFKSAAATAGLLAALSLPLGAQAMQAGAPQHYAFATAIVDDHHAGEIDGVLDLTISAGGIVQGSYRDADSGRIEPVAGGMQGYDIWFDVGSRGRLHVVGTLRDGVLRTVVQAPGPDTVTLNSLRSAKP